MLLHQVIDKRHSRNVVGIEHVVAFGVWFAKMTNETLVGDDVTVHTVLGVVVGQVRNDQATQRRERLMIWYPSHPAATHMSVQRTIALVGVCNKSDGSLCFSSDLLH